MCILGLAMCDSVLGVQSASFLGLHSNISYTRRTFFSENRDIELQENLSQNVASYNAGLAHSKT
jgi:hypothetical protein